MEADHTLCSRPLSACGEDTCSTVLSSSAWTREIRALRRTPCVFFFLALRDGFSVADENVQLDCGPGERTYPSLLR